MATQVIFHTWAVITHSTQKGKLKWVKVKFLFSWSYIEPNIETKKYGSHFGPSTLTRRVVKNRLSGHLGGSVN